MSNLRVLAPEKNKKAGSPKSAGEDADSSVVPDGKEDITKHFVYKRPSITKFDVIKYLNEFQDVLKSANIAVCRRLNKCLCKSDECECNSEEYAELKFGKADIASNCKYILEVNGARLSAKKQPNNHLRFFDLKETQEEIPLYDVKRAVAVLHVPIPVSFRIEEFVVQMRQDVCTYQLVLDYMSFVKLKSKESKSKWLFKW